MIKYSKNSRNFFNIVITSPRNRSGLKQHCTKWNWRYDGGILKFVFHHHNSLSSECSPFQQLRQQMNEVDILIVLCLQTFVIVWTTKLSKQAVHVYHNKWWMQKFLPGAWMAYRNETLWQNINGIVHGHEKYGTAANGIHFVSPKN